MQVLEGEVRLHDARGLHPGPQDILLRRDVGGLGYPVQVVQVAERRRTQESGRKDGEGCIHEEKKRKRKKRRGNKWEN